MGVPLRIGYGAGFLSYALCKVRQVEQLGMYLPINYPSFEYHDDGARNNEQQAEQCGSGT
jgi:hypothetical protein